MSRHEDVYQDFERLQRKRRRLNLAHKSAVVLLIACCALLIPFSVLTGLYLLRVPVELDWRSYMGIVVLWSFAELLLRKR